MPYFTEGKNTREIAFTVDLEFGVVIVRKYLQQNVLNVVRIGLMMIFQKNSVVSG